MHLKRLELQGFKSFADKTILEFRQGVTGVIGPNGSGKSNISDAIRWVLGEQSMKQLRGGKSEDVIFAGTENRKSLGFAEASIVIDNSDGKLPIEYNEVTVTRKIYRSGETGYFINKVPCRLKDILELFMDTGIGKDGYSIIGQGKIDEILSNKSEDRRHIFEEAAGIVKYRTRKQDAEKKLEQTKLNLLRINDILSEIEGQLEPLKFQSEKAKRYLSLRDELKEIEVGLFVYNINSYKEKLMQITEDLKILNEQNEDENKKQEENQSKKEKIKLNIENLSEEIEKMQNLGFESKNQIEQLNSQIGVSNEKLVNNGNNVERLENEISDLIAKINSLEEEKENRTSKKENLAQNREKFAKELEEKQSELEKILAKLSSKELEIEEKKRKQEENNDEKYEKMSKISSCDASIQALEKENISIKNELDSVISEIDSGRIKNQEIIKEFSMIEKTKKQKEEELSKINSQKEEVITRIKKYDDELNRLGQEYRIKEARYKFLQETEKEKEGYTKSVKSLLTACEKEENLKKGVEGVLANLISVKEEYEVAIEMCLASSMQNIVTETEADAKKLIEYLRKNNLGRASFLPISSVKGKKIDRLIKNDINGVVGIASDLVKYNKKYEGIILNLLGRTVVVQDMDTAISLAKQNGYSFRIVTLKGDLINPSGAISGGSVQTKTVNILGRNREIEELQNKLKELQEKINSLKEEQEEYSNKSSQIIEDSARIAKELQEIEISFATKKQEVDMQTQIVSKNEEKMNSLKEKNEKNKQEKADITVKKERLQSEISKLEEEIKNLNDEIVAFASENKENQTYIDNLNTDIIDLKISVSSFDESSNSAQEILNRIEDDIHTSNDFIIAKKKEIEDIKQDTEKLENLILELGTRIDEIKSKVENSSDLIEKAKSDKSVASEHLITIEKEIEAQYEVINGLKEQIIKVESKKQRLEQDTEELINKLWEEYELTPNNSDEYKKPDNVQEAQKVSNDLRKQMASLGPINVDAIEEYKKMQERYDSMNEQRYDIEESIKKIRGVISEMTQTMQTQFKERFKQINKNFNEVFAELFGGGKAELILEDENDLLECGIEIKAQPPGKKLENMTLLSGGERALTAIAILFAILKINPAPFCILDEIEAALDDVNVARYANYLKKFSKETQFLVITHRKGTMEIADTVYGVTMEEKGISKLLSINLKG